MGLFDSSGESEEDEVVIEAPEESKGGETRLGKEVETSLVDDSETGAGSEGSGIDLEDIHRQNETIIDLLEQLLGDRGSSDSRSLGRNSESSRGGVTDRGSDSSSRVTDREDSKEDESIGDGMNELL